MGRGEPLLYSEFINEFANMCLDAWRIRVEISLQVPTDNLKILTEDHHEMIDRWFVDIRTMDPDIYRAYTNGNLERVVNNLRYLKEYVETKCIIVRTPKILFRKI